MKNKARNSTIAKNKTLSVKCSECGHEYIEKFFTSDSCAEVECPKCGEWNYAKLKDKTKMGAQRNWAPMAQSDIIRN